eukprot:c17568_g1_i2.p1 GENE.c17568_g1_i2~~c17568_g1_i2.p1  ORF type:complete len:250 (+),score=81.38 c17568_g1_i2:43-792(+)
MADLGYSVRLIIESNSILDLILSIELSKLYEKVFEDKGIFFVKDTSCSSIVVQNQKVIGCQLSNGEIAYGDIIAVDIGKNPNVEKWKAAGITLYSNSSTPSISVDFSMRTNIPDVFAVGDVASLPLFVCEQSQLESSSIARHTTNHLANILANLPTNLDLHPHIRCSPFGFTFQFWGETNGPCYSYYGNIGIKLVAIWVLQGRVLGAFMEGGNEKEHQILYNVTSEAKLLNLSQLKLISDVEDLFSLIS